MLNKYRYKYCDISYPIPEKKDLPKLLPTFVVWLEIN